MTRTPTILAALALLLALAPGLAACSTAAPVDGPLPLPAAPDPAATSGMVDEPAADEPAGFDVCSLLTGVDTAALVNVETDAGSSQGDMCVVEPLDESSTGSLRVQFASTGGEAKYTQQLNLLGSDAEVAGFGDGAFLTGTWLHAYRGEQYLHLQVVPDIFVGAERLSAEKLVAAAQLVATNAGW